MILQNYLWQASEFFSRKDIDELNQAASLIKETTGQIGPGVNDDKDGEDILQSGTEDWSIRSSTIKWFEPMTMPEKLVHKIHDAVNMANEQCGWNHTWEYMENPQYTIYNEQPKRQGDFYTWHTDAGPMHYDNGLHRKLSMTIQLSDQDDYEGGHFQWLEPHQEFDKMTGTNPQVEMQNAIRTLSFSSKSIGSVCVFPSFLYHQVTPVLKGTRKSLVCWFAGKPYV
jgi:PKHD-type hydroxylase